MSTDNRVIYDPHTPLSSLTGTHPYRVTITYTCTVLAADDAHAQELAGYDMMRMVQGDIPFDMDVHTEKETHS